MMENLALLSYFSYKFCILKIEMPHLPPMDDLLPCLDAQRHLSPQATLMTLSQ